MRLRRGYTAVNENGTGGRLQKTVCQLDERGLAAAVRAKQTDDPSGLDRQIDVIQRAERAEIFGEPLTL